MRREESMLLRRAARLVEQGWCRGTYARDDLDRVAEPNYRATSWCALGALIAVTESSQGAVDSRVSDLSGAMNSLVPETIRKRCSYLFCNYNDRIAESAGEIATLMCFAADMIDSGDL